MRSSEDALILQFKETAESEWGLPEVALKKELLPSSLPLVPSEPEPSPSLPAVLDAQGAEASPSPPLVSDAPAQLPTAAQREITNALDENTNTLDDSPVMLSQQHSFLDEDPDFATGQIADLPAVGADDMQAYKRLVQQQKDKLNDIMSELKENGMKINHWIWYVFPTDRPGLSDSHETYVVKETATALCQNDGTALEWRAVLEETCALLEGQMGMEALPRIDHGRIHWFLKFWADVDAPAWMTSVCNRLSKFDWPPR
jgi:hypothetical protein